MAVKSMDALQPDDRAIRPGHHPCATSELHSTRYSTVCFAPDVATLVDGAGGWLFDRAMAGWDVSAFIENWSDPRALHVLGVRTAGLADARAAVQTAMPASIVVSGDLYARDEAVRRLLDVVVDAGADVNVFGAPCGLDRMAGTVPVSHRLTAAARAFKAQAVTAAGRGKPRRAAESFRQRDRARGSSHVSQLLSPNAVVSHLHGAVHDDRTMGSAK